MSSAGQQPVPKSAEKPSINSLLDEVIRSHGSFGRFLRVMHDTKPQEGSGPRTPPAGGRSLFPSFMLVPDDSIRTSSARIRARRRGRETSWKWAETLWALFTFLEGGAPSKVSDQLALANRARACQWSSNHAHFAGLLQQQIHEFVRLRSDDALSRGTQKLSEFIESIRPNNSSYKPGPYSIDELCQSAMSVKPERMSLPEQAGVIDPRDFLKGDNLVAFEWMPQDTPHDVPPAKPTKGCFKVEPQDLKAVYKKLVDSGVATLIPAALALRDHEGNIVSGGLFAVPHKEKTDRVILDRRPMNELERRMVMAKLPHGSLFTQLIIPKGCSIRASGDDLSNYFYLLKHHEDWLGRNTVGKPVSGSLFPEYGCDPNQDYMLSFRVIAMGDCNAVDLAQETHFQILQDAGCLRADETMAFKSVLPARATWEGLYIDDHIVTQITPKKKLRNPKTKFRDDEIIQQSRAKYAELGLPVSEKKQFTKMEDFTAWGTQVSSASGRVGAPQSKLRQLCQLLLEVCQLPFVTKKLMQKTVGLIVHPAMHRRIFMSLLQDTYTWIEKCHVGKRHKMPTAVKEELLWIAMSLPLMHANARWPVSCRVAATDASSTGGGRAATATTKSIAQTLYRFSEHRGEASRLDWCNGLLVPPSDMEPIPEELEKLMLAHAWSTTHKCKFGHKQHINILEMKMLKAELKELIATSLEPQRSVVLVDSRVVCGAFSKGRSSSRQLNRILRSMVGWMAVGHKSLHLVWVQSKANPSDYPSRNKPIPDPQVDDPIIVQSLGKPMPELQVRKSNKLIRKLALHDPAPEPSQTSVPSEACHPAQKHWTFKEVFAGKGRLTAEFKARGKFLVSNPIELIQRGKPNKHHDVLNDVTFNRLCEQAKKPRQFWHFGLPCCSFSIMQNMNGGTRTSEHPEGLGVLERELVGNELLYRTVYLCKLLVAHGNFFTIENPHSSYVWHMKQIKHLIDYSSASVVVLDQCAYGLMIPDSHNNLGLAKKGTIFMGNLPGLEKLGRRCSHDHQHVQVIGGVKHEGKWHKRSTLAGAYPIKLCRAYHSCCERLFAV